MATYRNLLKSILEAEALTQGQLAEASNVSARTIGKACSGSRIRANSKRKIVQGLNQLTAEGKYTVQNVFPLNSN